MPSLDPVQSSIDFEKTAVCRDSTATDSTTDSFVDVKVAVIEVKTATSTNEEAVPPKSGHSSSSRWLDLIFLSYYRKIFTIIFSANLITFIIFVVRNYGTPNASGVGSAAFANLMVALLFRQENFVNLVYEIVCSIMVVLGAGTAAVIWFIMYTAVVTKDYIARPNSASLASLITSYILVIMLCLILAGAWPRFRVLYHDYFEAMHRCAGWTALGTFWIHTIFAANEFRVLEDPVRPLGFYLIQISNFWTLCVSTSCIIISWGRLRRHQVHPEVLSSHAIRLHFKYRNMKPFYGLKMFTKPLLEWHAFATIPDEDANGKPDDFSIIVSNAGDWTNETIRNPPNKLWIRGAPLYGLLYASKLFKRIVAVATGSGIGPMLSLFHADVTPCHILWSTPNPETTYGEKVVNAVIKVDPNARIWDTRTKARPDMVMETWKLVKESDAEAVFIISNPKVTRKVVFGMESRGIPAYGAIFNS
ncbi:non-ribosomal peptide synthetase [Moniliophthora roreri MCA 2997]|uniref:Non-ribosomal peptide synthetase n=1 Tax=Moniliophthora roreri (strain MCA 2997) TaxID=1381753 RepID=V2X9V9_MONRO|nr:non-ribosomal peptide synthetase [Moniliophthora roreri MCA 2997]